MRWTVAGIAVVAVVVGATLVWSVSRNDAGSTRPGESTSSTTVDDQRPASFPSDQAIDALDGVEAGDVEEVRAFLDSDGAALDAIPTMPLDARCGSNLEALVAEELSIAAVQVPDRWLAESALVVVGAAEQVIESCEAEKLDGDAADRLDRGADLYNARLTQMGIER